MYGYPRSFVLFILLVGAAIGLLVGLISLRLNFSFRKTIPGLWGLLVDIVLGIAGFSGGVVAAMLAPMPSRTTVHHVGGTVIHETTRRFQHPYIVGAAVAILFTFVFEFVRSRRTKRLVCLAACLGAAFAHPQCAHAAESWLKLTTPHFELYTTEGEKKGREAILYFEQVRSFFLDTNPSRNSPDSPVRIIAFHSAKQYQPYALNAFGTAFYTHDDNRDYIVMQDIAPEHYPVAIHEYTHLIIRHSGLHLPIWLNEGWADLYSTMKPKGPKVMVGDLIPGRVQTLLQGPWIPLATLGQVDHRSPLYNERDRAGMFYAESWALTHMLYLAPEYGKSFGRFVQAVSSGRSLEDAFQEALGKPLADVERDLHRYLGRNQLYAALFNTRLTKSDEEPDVAEPTALDINLALADVLTLTNKPVQARAMYESLLQQNPNNPEVEESLGYLAWHEGGPAAARKHFLLALDNGTHSALMCFRLGMLSHGSDAEHADAIRAFRKALELKPGYIDARLHLGIALLESRSYSDSLKELSEIHKIPEESANEFFYAKAFDYARLGNYDEARKNAEGARKWAKTPFETNRIDGLFKYLDSKNASAQSR